MDGSSTSSFHRHMRTMATRPIRFVDRAPSWKVLKRLADKMGPLPMRNGADARALERKFGQQDTPRVKLYRDHAAWCPYCQKVWLQLEEKKVPYHVEKINMRYDAMCNNQTKRVLRNTRKGSADRL